MRPTYEITAVAQAGSLVASGGTVTPTGVDWSVTYEPDIKAVINVGANASGAVAATLEQSAVVGSGYTTLATISAGTVAGVYTTDAVASQEFVRITSTVTGGTALITSTLFGKKRTVL